MALKSSVVDMPQVCVVAMQTQLLFLRQIGVQRLEQARNG